MSLVGNSFKDIIVTWCRFASRSFGLFCWVQWVVMSSWWDFTAISGLPFAFHLQPHCCDRTADSAEYIRWCRHLHMWRPYSLHALCLFSLLMHIKRMVVIVIEFRPGLGRVGTTRQWHLMLVSGCSALAGQAIRQPGSWSWRFYSRHPQRRRPVERSDWESISTFLTGCPHDV